MRPKITDDDKSEISVTLDGKELMAWSYATKADRDEKMRHAWYFCDGFMAGRGAPLKQVGEIAQADWTNRAAEPHGGDTVAGIQIGYDRAISALGEN